MMETIERLEFVKRMIDKAHLFQDMAPIYVYQTYEYFCEEEIRITEQLLKSPSAEQDKESKEEK